MTSPAGILKRPLAIRRLADEHDKISRRAPSLSNAPHRFRTDADRRGPCAHRSRQGEGGSSRGLLQGQGCLHLRGLDAWRRLRSLWPLALAPYGPSSRGRPDDGCEKHAGRGRHRAGELPARTSSARRNEHWHHQPRDDDGAVSDAQRRQMGLAPVRLDRFGEFRSVDLRVLAAIQGGERRRYGRQNAPARDRRRRPLVRLHARRHHAEGIVRLELEDRHRLSGLANAITAAEAGKPTACAASMSRRSRRAFGTA